MIERIKSAFSLSGMKANLTKILELWPDFIAIPAVIIGVWVSYYAFALLDPSMGTFDMGILQALLFVAAVLITINALVYLGVKYNNRELWKYYKDDSWLSPLSDFNQITAWQRLKLFYCWVGFQFLLGVVIFINLI